MTAIVIERRFGVWSDGLVGLLRCAVVRVRWWQKKERADPSPRIRRPARHERNSMTCPKAR